MFGDGVRNISGEGRVKDPVGKKHKVIGKFSLLKCFKEIFLNKNFVAFIILYFHTVMVLVRF